MLIIPLAWLLLPALSSGPLRAHQEGASQEPSAKAQAEAGEGEATPHVDFGPPLIVNGEAIGPEAFKRFFVLGIGASQLNKFKYDGFLQEEVQRRVAAGEPAEIYVVTDLQVDDEIALSAQEFRKRFPTLNYLTEIERSFVSMPLYRELVRQQLTVDRLFLPNNPDEWPPLTLEALALSEGSDFLPSAKDAYAERLRQAQEQGIGSVPEEPPFWKDLWRSMIIDAINAFLQVEWNADVLPDGVALQVDGIDIKFDDVFAQIQHVLTPERVEEARTWLAITSAIEQYLEREGALISYTDFLAEWVPEGTSFHEAFLRHELLATAELGFPSTYTYIDELRLEHSYERILARSEEWGPEGWSKRADLCSILGASEVEVEMILISAFDFRNNCWKPDGWSRADESAKIIRERLERSDAKQWPILLDRYSEFYDPPVAQDAEVPDMFLMNKGRFRSQNRNELLSALGEGQYRNLLHGRSVADFVFFEQKVGTWAGPMKGVHGFYFSKLKNRTQPVGGIKFEHPIVGRTARIYALRLAICELARRMEAEGEFVGWNRETD